MQPYRMPKRAFLFSMILLTATALLGSRPAMADGPGTEMTQIINRMGLGADCGRCQSLADEMDRRGADWVMKNRHLVATRTIDNAARLGHTMGPAKRMGVRVMVRTAARRSR